MMRSPEQQFNTAKALPISELAKVLQGQSDIVDMSIAEMVLRQKMQAQKAQQGAAALPLANAPKVVQQDLSQAQQMMRPQMPQQAIQPRTDMGIGAVPAPNMEQMGEPKMMAAGGIVAFDDGGPVRHFQYGGSTARVPSFMSAFGGSSERTNIVPPTMMGGVIIAADGVPRSIADIEKGIRAANPNATEGEIKGMLQNALATLQPKAPPSIARTPTTSAPAVIAQTAAPAAALLAPAAPPAPAAPVGIAALDTRLVDKLLPMPAEKPRKEITAERLAAYKELGVDPDIYKKQIAELEKQKISDAEARREAGWGRALEAGLGIMGGTSPYGFTNIGQGSAPAAKGAMEDAKEFRKLERDRKKTEADLLVAQNAYNKSGADADLARVEKLSDHRDTIMAKRADLTKDIYVANQTLRAHEATRQDTREATFKAAALKQAEAEMAKKLALNPQLATDPTAYQQELDSIYYAHLRRLMGEKAPERPMQGGLQQINGRLQYVPSTK